jgi:Delta7-sterol 5-desaturase
LPIESLIIASFEIQFPNMEEILHKSLTEFTTNISVEVIRYIGVVGIVYLLVWIIFKPQLLHRLIQQKFPPNSRLRIEFLYSLSSMFIFSLIGVGIFLIGGTRLYMDVASHGWPYFFLSIALAILIHDTYFYWTHRLMHHPRLYKHMHQVHHQSTNPSPWAAYSFHPLEAVVQGMIGPILLFTLPMHVGALVAFGTYQIVLNAFGHLSFELFPRGFTKSKWVFWHNTTTHHNMHHRYFNSNYTLYFNIWDRIMGTLHPKYDEQFEEVTQREPLPKSEGSLQSAPKV